VASLVDKVGCHRTRAGIGVNAANLNTGNYGASVVDGQ
jgi:hypothetical protein